MRISCYIIEDEPPAINVLSKHIDRIDSLQLIDTFTDPVLAIQKLQEKPVDLIFLDIKMPKLTGIDFLKTLHNPPHVILTTAYREFALEGFELDVVDYLLKPISFERFLKAVNKVIELEQDKGGSSSIGQNKDVYFQVNNEHIKVNLSEITYIESDRNNVQIFLKSGEVLSARTTMTSLEEKLPEPDFLRIHRSFICNIHHIDSFTQSSITVDDEQIPIGRSYKQGIIKTLKNHSQII